MPDEVEPAVERLLLHELREPLRHIDAFHQFLSEDEAAGLSEQGRTYLDSISAASDRLRAILDGWATYRRMETVALEMTRLELTPICERVFERERRELDVRAAIEIDEPLGRCTADPTLLETLFAELFRNALMYRAHNREPLVRITRDDDRGLTVADNGTGLLPGAASRVFEPFARRHRATHHHGSGLGLAIADRIAKRHGWSLSVAPGSEWGARLTIAFSSDAP